MTTLQEVQSAANQLSPEDRGALAEYLLGTLDSAESGEIRAAWLSVAQDRLADLRSGRVVGVPAAEVLRAMSESGS
jgi:exosome complex RNA-binding protein Rrp4